MNPELNAAEFLSFSRNQRIAKCREMAAEAEKLANGKTRVLRAEYLLLAAKWSELADEMERHSGG